jgi:gas vesicle protein
MPHPPQFYEGSYFNSLFLTPFVIWQGCWKIIVNIHLKTYSMSLQKIMLGTLTGIVIGMLIAPAKGSETRQKLSESAEKLKAKLRRIRGATNEELDELKDVFEHEVAGLREDVRLKILKLIEATKSGYYHVKDEAMAN